MALPKIDNPTYTLELPSTGEVVKYRPFLVKEQKVLMLAQQSDKAVDRNNAIVQIIESCTFGKVTDKSPLFDIEYVFLKLRSKSAGETVNVTLTCPDDGETKDTVKINLDDVDVNMTEHHTNKINITDSVQMTMRYPLINDIDANVKEDQLTTVMEFFNSMPKLRHPVKVKNKNTGVESEVILEGLENFL